MELLISNILGKTRRATLNGRQYLVAPATLIVPGVLTGSKGDLFYPLDEIRRNASDWNGMPIVGYHPTINGQNVSARSPDILAKQGLGYVYNTTANDKLAADMWFDVQSVDAFDKTLPHDARIMPRLLAGKPIELSTGLYTDNTPAANGANHNGKPYTHIARNYRPDHLAVLPDQRGACSINDGCGVLINKCGNCKDESCHCKYTFNAEDCPKCGASMEGDPDSGKCNSCGYKWGQAVENVFCPTGKGGGQDNSCGLEKAQKSVDKLSSKVAKAKATFDKLKAELKGAKLNLKAIKANAKSNTSSKRDVKPVVKHLKDIEEKLLSEAKSGKSLSMSEEDVMASVKKAIGKMSVHQTAKEYGIGGKQKSSAVALEAIVRKIRSRAGSYARSQI